MKTRVKFLRISILLTLLVALMLPVPIYAAGETGAGDELGGEGISVEDGEGEEISNQEAVAAEQQAYADSGSAIQDILNNPRYKGAISTISAVTNFVDNWFVKIVTIVAFFIISAALLKNACAGAYCANNKFWDKVDAAHKANEAISLAKAKDYFTNKGFMNTTGGGIRDFLLGLIPNIKAFTDFEDQDISPKAYFMRAIPQMIACVIIGVFIYNGYYRDVSATVGQMGSVIVERTLLSVDPEGIINFAFNMTSWPPSPFEKDPTREGKAMEATFKAVRNAISTKYTDITSNTDKNSLTNNLATSIQKSFNAAVNTKAVEEGGSPDSGTDTQLSLHDYFDSSNMDVVPEGMMYSVNNVECVLSTSPGFVNGEGTAEGEGESDGAQYSYKIYNFMSDGNGNPTAMIQYDLSYVHSAQMDTAGRYALVTITLKKSTADGSPGTASTVTIGTAGTATKAKKLKLPIDATTTTIDLKKAIENGGTYQNVVIRRVTVPTQTTVNSINITSNLHTAIKEASPDGLLIAVGEGYAKDEKGKTTAYNLYLYATEGSGEE